MRLPPPKFAHPPETYEAIIREHRENAHRMGELLMVCGWSIGDAAWAILNWDLRTLAAAIAHERDKRRVKPSASSDAPVAGAGKPVQSTKKATAPLRPPRTTRVVLRTVPRTGERPARKSEEPPA